MNNFGFVKVAGIIPHSKVAGIEHNAKQIIALTIEAAKNGAQIVVFPELSLTGYTCGDLFMQATLIKNCETQTSNIIKETANLPVLIIFGLPVINNNKLFNCACVVNQGKILGIIPKSFIPGYKEFYEPRWFAGKNVDHKNEITFCSQNVPFGTNILFVNNQINNLKIGVEICEDLWVPVPPSCNHTLAGATLICNLSASNVLVAKNEYRRELVKNQSGRCICGYIYVSAGTGESTTDVVFDADAVIAENGSILTESERFLRKNQIIYSEIDIERLSIERAKMNSFDNITENYREIQFAINNQSPTISRYIDSKPFVPQNKNNLDIRCMEIFNIQASGLAKRLETLPDVKAVIGVSGGLDSTLALLVIVRTFEILGRNPKDIITITMPGFGTTDRTYNNAVSLCKELGTTFKEISIRNISNTMFLDLGLNPDNHNITYENIQARARTYILMSVANEENGLVIGTGDLSEIALGWCTYNGDHISMYNVNSSVPKTLIKFLVNWVAENHFTGKIRNTLLDIINQPISPELLPSDGKQFTQVTEDKIGPYELHDFFLYYFVRFGFKADKIIFLANIAFKDKYTPEIIKKWLVIFFKRFFSNQWKRDCVPAGPKVGSIDLSPRGSWRMPAEASVEDWLK